MVNYHDSNFPLLLIRDVQIWEEKYLSTERIHLVNIVHECIKNIYHS